MSETASSRFDASEVIEIASMLGRRDDLIVVGGQATALWAWFYHDRLPQSLQDAPLASKDIDYFGYKNAAVELAKVLNGEVLLPDFDDATPNTAIVRASFNGKLLEIDLLKAVLGVTNRELTHDVSVINLGAVIDGRTCIVPVHVMHPINCLKSRVANVLHPAMRRDDPLTMQQLAATVAILRAHIDQGIDDDLDDAMFCFRQLGHFLRSDKHGKYMHLGTPFDAMSVLETFENDQRLDVRYRENNLKKSIVRIRDYRQSLAARHRILAARQRVGR